MIIARKFNKIPAFYMTFGRNMPEFYISLPEKYFSGIFFFWGGGQGGNPLPGAGPQAPHQQNPALGARRSDLRKSLQTADAAPLH